MFIFSAAALLDPGQAYRQLAEHGISFLQDRQRDHKHGGYYWELKGRSVSHSVKRAYGHAFVLLAAAMAAKAGISSAVPMIADTFEVLERHFWRENEGLYVDEISADWSEVSPYSG